MRALIVGGGIAGLAAASALHRARWDVEVVERDPARRDRGTGLYLPGNGARALDRLGVLAPVLDRAVLIESQRILDHRGRVLVEIDLPRTWGGCGPCLALPRAELHRVLYDACGAPIRHGETVVSLGPGGDGVAVTLSGGGRRDVDLLVGADGIRSSIRRLLGDAGVPRPVGQLSWRFVVEELPDVRTWTALLGDGRTFLLVPIGAGRVYCYADVNATENATEPSAGPATAGSGRLRELFADFAGPVPAALDRVDSSTALHVAPIEELVVTRPAVGGVVLIGDAAHATSPNMAQGAVMACEDGLVLADELTTGYPVPAALAAFTSRRAPRTRWVRRRTHRRDRARALPAPARSALLRLVGNRMYRADYRSLLDEP